ncbi:hypothetical protein [Actinocrispum wychmicini]|uniref:Uncharacterized protein n=1 Tax=Actinocrispum wychmicini TaxID=1213861 RepID=A0A4R2JJJ9_9PSEU|nr:hypothetical protein [Actinocrispum wychmicini]TCO57188.1 hypothetical protein EV192_106665 [Actinocrispum wychmicini]
MTATMPCLGDLRALGVVVTAGVIEPEPCPCGEIGAVTTVRVYGDPASDLPVLDPVDAGGVECCWEFCALEVAGRAVSEQDSRSRRPIRVEVTL